MIQTPTTFIVGAGASVPYHLPIGEELVERAQGLTPSTQAYQALLQTRDVTVTQLNDFREDISRHRWPSIDAFLEARQERPATMHSGRLIIAALMGQAVDEARQNSTVNGGDWIAYVIEQMRKGAPNVEAFANGNRAVRFVTFNFDTIVEERIRAAMLDLYHGAVSSTAITEAMTMFPVIHVHGVLPSIPGHPLEPDNYGAFSTEWTGWLPRAASQIRVVLDDIETQTVERARDAVEQAEVLCFLGFGYDNTSLRRIQPSAWQSANANQWRSNSYGSAFGLRPGQQATVKSRVPNINLGNQTGDCLDVLLDFHIFRS